ncbi:MAG TPA: hypothetical protein VJV78_06280 [Polyangiales bacterium]|nr:hypothetical protein [Polyangiales bacterium]
MVAGRQDHPTRRAAREQELVLNGNGPCIDLLAVDASHAYFDSARGLVRVKLSDLRGM